MTERPDVAQTHLKAIDSAIIEAVVAVAAVYVSYDAAETTIRDVQQANIELGTTILIVRHNQALAERRDRALEVVGGQRTNAVH